VVTVLKLAFAHVIWPGSVSAPSLSRGVNAAALYASPCAVSKEIVLTAARGAGLRTRP
jgi:hypothetical protein